MKRILSILFAVTVALSMGVVTGPTTAAEFSALDFAAIINVPADYPTIQEAVDAAGPGYMIMVAEGEYDGFLVMENSDITIVGANGATVTTEVWLGIDPVLGVETWALAAVVESEDIRIEGLDFDGAGVSQEAFFGIVYLDSTGSISDLTVESVVGTEVGIGVVIAGESGTFAVDLSGVTVENSMVGVYLGNAETSLHDCTITGMSAAGGYGILEEGIGVLVGVPWFSGMPIHYTDVRIKGCTISDSDAGINVWGDADLEAYFNMIVDNSEWGVLNETLSAVNAVNNWWGQASGPFHPTANPDGTGNSVSDNVEFDPWLTADIGPVHTETVTGNGVVDATEQADTKVEVWGSGTTTVTVSRYGSNPHGGPPTDVVFLGKYIDVYVPDTSQVTQIEIRIYFTADEVDESEVDEESLLLFWWNGDEWEPLEETGAVFEISGGYSGYIWGRITEDTRPSLDYLKGGAFPTGQDVREGPTSPSGGCFIATAAYGTDTAQQLDILRDFRDTILLPNSLGASLVSFYYRTSPPIASFISQHEGLRTAVRVGLVDPIVGTLNRTYDSWSPRGPA